MYLAIDLGGTYIKYGALNQHGEVLYKNKVPTPKHSIEELYSAIDQCLDEVSKQYALEGIAISSPGAVTDHGVVEGVSALPYIHGPNIKEELSTRYNLPVSIENDANCAAIAEVKAGNAKGCKDVLFVVCGTGVGGAVIKDGRLHKGNQLFGGEFGMMVQYDHTTQSTQSFSWLASTGNMARRASEATGREMSGVDVFKFADEGDKTCLAEVNAFYIHLATLLTNLQSVYDPELIVVSGGVTERESFGDELNNAITQINQIRGSLAIDTKAVTAKFRNDANMIGAVFKLTETLGPQSQPALTIPEFNFC